MDMAWMLSFSKDEVHLDCKDPFGYTLNEKECNAHQPAR